MLHLTLQHLISTFASNIALEISLLSSYLSHVTAACHYFKKQTGTNDGSKFPVSVSSRSEVSLGITGFDYLCLTGKSGSLIQSTQVRSGQACLLYSSPDPAPKVDSQRRLERLLKTLA